MPSIEQQMTEINGLNNSITRMEIKVNAMDSDLRQTNITMSEYQHSIDTYSDLCEEMRKDKESNDTEIEDLKRRVSNVERDQYAIQSDQKKCENTLTDLQCRSMLDNLIFTNIDEIVRPETDEYENVEQTLIRFLWGEMGIHKPIEFARVHRLGTFDKDSARDNPRPIIAKFERFKDRDYVRGLAAETLKGKQFRIREQFPKVIEEKRKMLYPVAKEARKSTENKVRLVRDKLYVNGQEVFVETNTSSESVGPSTKPWSRNKDSQSETQNPWKYPKSRKIPYRGERVFYRGGGTRRGDKPHNPGAKVLDFSLPTSNQFELLTELNETPVPQNLGNTNSVNSSMKHPASSPLDDANITKRQRKEIIIQVSDPDTDSDEHSMVVSPGNKSSNCTPTESPKKTNIGGRYLY